MALLDYTGQTTDELLDLEGKYRPYALIFAFEEALGQKLERALGQESWGHVTFNAMKDAAADVGEGRPVRGPLTEEELIVLAIVSLERQVHNGGYDLLFCNCVEFTPMLVKALRRIGRDDVAEATQAAIDSLNIEGPLNPDTIHRGRDAFDKEQRARLGECDSRFYAIAYPPAEDILDVSLWNFIKKNRDKITVP